MPEEKFPTPEVNLLSGDDFENQTQGKFLKWALTWGKRIVILTELVVILVFLSRFWLDTTVADLNDKITQKQAVIKASIESEDRFRRLATRLKRATIIENTTSVLTIYDQVQSLMPQSIKVNQINVSAKSINLNGISDETSLAKLVNDFRNSNNFLDINVEKISKQTAGSEVSFSLKATYVQ